MTKKAGYKKNKEADDGSTKPMDTPKSDKSNSPNPYSPHSPLDYGDTETPPPDATGLVEPELAIAISNIIPLTNATPGSNNPTFQSLQRAGIVTWKGFVYCQQSRIQDLHYIEKGVRKDLKPAMIAALQNFKDLIVREHANKEVNAHRSDHYTKTMLNTYQMNMIARNQVRLQMDLDIVNKEMDGSIDRRLSATSKLIHEERLKTWI